MTTGTAIVGLITLFIGFALGLARDNNKTVFTQKLKIYSELMAELSKASYLREESRNELIHLFAPARLLASKELEDELRDFYSNIAEYWSEKNKEQQDKLLSKTAKNVMEIEQLMRIELGASRIYTRERIEVHANKRS